MESAGRLGWWTRPCGGLDVLRIALPLVASTLSWTVMNFTDRTFLVWYDTAAMAATLPSGMLQFTMLCFPLGLALYANTFVAQYEGAKRYERIGLAVWQAVWIGAAATPLLLATIPLAPAMFALAGHEPHLAALEVEYYQAVTLGGGGTLIAAALTTFFTGRGQTVVVMLVDTGAAILNIVLDYVWIFGYCGFPESGIAGAAWATAVSQWARAAAYWLLAEFSRHRHKYGWAAGRRLDLALMRRLWRYGFPNGVQFLVETAAFTVFILLIGWLGQEAVAASTLAFNVNCLAFVPVLGVGTAVSTMVGQQQGRNRPDLAARATWTAFWMASVYTAVFAALYILTPNVFLWAYAAGVKPEEFEGLRELVVMLLRFVAAYSMFDATNIIFSGAIKGAGDTRFILLTTLIMSPVPVLVAWLGVQLMDWGLIWCWVALTGWICSLGSIYLTRFLLGHWRRMHVIEPEVFAEESTISLEPELAVHWGQTAVVRDPAEPLVEE